MKSINTRFLFIAIIALTFIASINANAATFTVTNTLDSGAGSFRQAILDANAAANAPATTPDVIAFAITGTAPFTIQPLTELPIITEAVNINGYTQAGSVVNGGQVAGTGCNGSATLQIIVNGANAGTSSNGFTINAAGSTIQGLVINGFDGNGIEINGVSMNTGNNTVSGNFIGTDVTGLTAVPNNSNGVIILNGTNNVIGGFAAADRNIISGNAVNGISINGTTGSSNNFVQGNFVGLNKTGNADLGNGVSGIEIAQSRNNVIGGSSSIAGCAPANIVSGNEQDGITLFGMNAVNNQVQGNLIGTGIGGTGDFGNTSQGIFINASGNFIGSSTPTTRNVISGNNGGGINIGGGGNSNIVRGNFIGTTADGLAGINTTSTDNSDGVRIDAGANNNQIGGSTVSGLQTAYAVNATNALLRFNPNASGATIPTTTVGVISGLQTGETIVGIDFRPATRQLYALGSTSRLYIVNTANAVATQVGAAGAFTLSGTEFGFDFNPTVDRIRVVSNTGQNLRLNPNDGTLTMADAALNGAATRADGAGYTNNDADPATGTILYYVDAASDMLYTTTNPNGGVLTTVGALGVDITEVNGFDINSVAGGNTAYLTATVGTTPRLFSINLGTGAATPIANLSGTLNVRGLALEIASPEILPTYGLTNANQLVRFGVNRTNAVSTIAAITGLQAGETIVGIDFRPATRQLYALGSTSRLYIINPTNAVATLVAALTDSVTGNPVTLTGTEFGVDFNPVPDRFRVVGNDGQNLRINPANGVTNVDTPLNTAATRADAAAYTNNFGGTTTTILYYIDSATDTLYTTTNPNGGVLTTVGALGVNTTEVNGFDITTFGTTNTAYAALTVGGASNLYQINLTSGAATLVGAIGGNIVLRGLAVEIGATTTASAANVISSNNVGVNISEGDNNVVRGNFIGTGANGTSDVGNLEAGIYIQQPTSMNNVIGGLNIGDGNVISFNGDGTTVPTLFGEAGIAVFAGATNNPIYGNGIVSNTGAGIDLGISDADGVTANDPLDVDSGNGNNLQNFPSLTSANSGSSTTTISGTLDSTASTTFRVEFFSSVAADAGGNGEGRVFLGSTNVTTNIAGNATISFVSQIRVSGGQVVTATATNPNGDTSEFSNAQTVTGAVTAAGVSVSGSARTAQGKRIKNAQITMTSIEGNVRTTFTNAFGNFKFTDVAAGQTHVFSIRSKTYTFEQPSQVVSLSEDVDNLDFIATPRGRTN